MSSLMESNWLWTIVRRKSSRQRSKVSSIPLWCNGVLAWRQYYMYMYTVLVCIHVCLLMFQNIIALLHCSPHTCMCTCRCTFMCSVMEAKLQYSCSSVNQNFNWISLHCPSTQNIEFCWKCTCTCIPQTCHGYNVTPMHMHICRCIY